MQYGVGEGRWEGLITSLIIIPETTHLSTPPFNRSAIHTILKQNRGAPTWRRHRAPPLQNVKKSYETSSGGGARTQTRITGPPVSSRNSCVRAILHAMLERWGKQALPMLRSGSGRTGRHYHNPPVEGLRSKSGLLFPGFHYPKCIPGGLLRK